MAHRKAGVIAPAEGQYIAPKGQQRSQKRLKSSLPLPFPFSLHQVDVYANKSGLLQAKQHFFAVATSQLLSRGSFSTVAYLLMRAKPSSTDLMAFLLHSSPQEEMEGAGEDCAWREGGGQKLWTGSTFLLNQKQNSGY